MFLPFTVFKDTKFASVKMKAVEKKSPAAAAPTPAPVAAPTAPVPKTSQPQFVKSNSLAPPPSNTDAYSVTSLSEGELVIPVTPSTKPSKANTPKSSVCPHCTTVSFG